MRYGPMDRQRVDSPLTGRGTGLRHSGGGAMQSGKKGMAPTGGFMRAPGQASLQVNGMQPNPGALAPDQPMMSSSSEPSMNRGKK